MEIDGGPPPFCATVDDDDDAHPFEKNPFDDVDDDDESSPDSSSLPLPVTPVMDIKREEEKEGESQERGDTNASEPQNEQNIEEDDDEWGDFGEAVAAPAPIQNIPPPVPPLEMNNMDDDDDWGDFDQARPSTDRSAENATNPSSTRSQEVSQEARQLAHQQSLEEWGAFEENHKNSGDEDDEWQAEFASAPPAPAVVARENLKILEEMLEDGEFWDDGFVEDELHEDATPIDVVDIPTLFDSETLEEMCKEFQDQEKQKHSKLWLALRVIEEAISLKFDWKKSDIQKNHFKSIKINPVTFKKEIRSTAAAFDTSSLLLPTSVLQPTSSSSESHDPKTSTSSPSNDVPAVDFDWDTSGLTNPMNRANQSSAIIDVDFLGSNGVATAYTSTLQKDLEHFGLNGVSTTASSSNGSTILETLMSRANGHPPGRFRTPEVLSLDAQKLLEKLPDLQYLQSEVLMFPVGTNLPH